MNPLALTASLPPNVVENGIPRPQKRGTFIYLGGGGASDEEHALSHCSAMFFDTTRHAAANGRVSHALRISAQPGGWSGLQAGLSAGRFRSHGSTQLTV